MTKGKTTRRTAKDETFTFTFEGKRYSIRQPYRAQPATLILSDGTIIQVTRWKLLPVEPEADQVERFDPQIQSAAALAEEKGGFFAELIEK